MEENEEIKVLWDYNIQTDRAMHHRRPHIVIHEKKKGKTNIADSNFLIKRALTSIRIFVIWGLYFITDVAMPSIN